jgi:hypothetical protein
VSLGAVAALLDLLPRPLAVIAATTAAAAPAGIGAFTWKESIPLVGAFISSAATLFVGLFVTFNLTASIKKTEFLIGFGHRFGEINDLQYEFNLAAQSRDAGSDLTQRDRYRAEHIYREYFTLIFDEFYAYRHGFLDSKVFALWMSFCIAPNDDSGGVYSFDLEGLPQGEAWNKFRLQEPLKGDIFVRFVDVVFRCKRPDQIKALVNWFSSNWIRKVWALSALGRLPAQLSQPSTPRPTNSPTAD